MQVAQVQPGDRVRVHPGAMIPVDGFVCEGESFVHEASMSGEAFAASRRWAIMSSPEPMLSIQR